MLDDKRSRPAQEDVFCGGWNGICAMLNIGSVQLSSAQLSTVQNGSALAWSKLF
jgi:hypothetical protein